MKNQTFKERMLSKRGSVLFIVLVIMSFMLVLASAVFYAVQNGRKNVVMDYSDSQAFQTANDVLEAMDAFFLSNLPTDDGIKSLNQAIASLQVHCPRNYPNCDYTAKYSDTSRGFNDKMCPRDYDKIHRCAVAIWTDPANKGLTRDQLMAMPGGLEKGTHYLQTTAPGKTLAGTGDVSVLIYANAEGNIVFEVTVEYNGRKVTTSRYYDVGDQRAFVPRWIDPRIDKGGGLHWEWVSNEYPWPGDKDSSWGTTANDNRIISGHFLFGGGAFAPSLAVQKSKCWVAPNAKNGWGKRVDPGTICRSDQCVDPTAPNCPEAATGGCFFSNGRYPDDYPGDDSLSPDAYLRGHWKGGCHDAAWDACYTGYGWWIWVGDTQPAEVITPGLKTDASTQWPPATNTYGYSGEAPWKDVTWGKKTNTGSWEKVTCFEQNSGKCECATPPSTEDVRWRIGRIWDWLGTPPDPPKVKVTIPPCEGKSIDLKTNGTNEVVDCAHCTEDPTTAATLVLSGVGKNIHDTKTCDKGCAVTTEGWVHIPRCGVCYLCDPSMDITVGPIVKDDEGNFPFTIPGLGFSWKQKEAYQITGLTGASGEWSDTSLTALANRGTNSATFYDTEWTLLHDYATGGGVRRGEFRGDIAAKGHMVIGDVNIENPHGGVLTIAVGKNLHILSKPESPAIPATVSSFMNMNGSINGWVDVIVGGDMHVRSKDGGNYGSEGGYFNNPELAFFVFGDLHLNDGSLPGSARVYLAGNVRNRAGEIITNDNGRIIPMDPTMMVTMQAELAKRITSPGVEPWGIAPPTREKKIMWGASSYNLNAMDDWKYTGTVDNPKWDYCPNGGSCDVSHNNPLCNNYGIKLSQDMKDRVYYINESATISNISQSTTRSGLLDVLIVDTGLEGNLITLNLEGYQAGGVFCWKPTNSAVNASHMVAILTLGNGTVVFNVPSGVQYIAGAEATGTASRMGIYVGSFNLAVQQDTSSNWLGDARLNSLTFASNNGANHYNPSCKCSDSCFLTSLLKPDGSGQLREDITYDEIKPRNHTNPVNLHVYIMSGNRTPPIELKQRSFFAGTIYAPTMSFKYDSNATGVVMFGSFNVAELQIGTMDYFISVLPGGGIGKGNPSRGSSEFDGDLPDIVPGWGDVNSSSGGLGDDTFDALGDVGRGDTGGRR